MILKPGQFIYITQGEYSDYIVLGVFIVIKGFDSGKMGKRYLKVRQDAQLHWDETGKDADYDTYLGLNFGAWLLHEGLVAEIAAEEVHEED